MRALRLLGGLLRIRVEGGAERFFNVCRRCRLGVWDIRRVEDEA